MKVDSSGIRKVFELAAKLENPVNFSIGQPDFDVPEAAKDAAIEAIKKGLNRYTLTQGIGELREKVLGYIAKTRGRNYRADEVVITSGVSGGLFLALISILDPGDEVVFFDPYFVMYKHLINLLEGKPVIVDTYPDFRVREEALRKAVSKKTKAILVNSPSNPSGYVYSKEDIAVIVKVAKEKNILVISDEIYDGFVYDGQFDSPSSLYDNVMVLGGFSKTYAMTGWRLGYALGPAEIIASMIKLQQYSFVCAPAPFQYAAAMSLELDTEDNRKNYRTKRDIIYNGLKDNFDIVKPAGAFYMFPRLKKGNATDFVEMAIREQVLIIPGNVFSEKDTNFRISFATTEEALRRGIDILNRVAVEYYAKVKG
jgi:aspartate aminotransferase/aminotransferase